ncbi:MAG: DEAD/DEAH box helicase [Candidatus Eisenbacteria bacterium]|uniref:DEAD/DEAH box helicase n=1 Tax=Eiseniibacteriota bacterium TaxID=2212470 RepID=A0A849SCF4_UNCEI|nr:DEAD/DEAH box helicase [Candidatus Eisenbacteria bacterium]
MPFANLGLPPVIVKGARAAGYVEPTPIQRKAIPIIMQGNDIVAAAAAGSGKTAAYLLPILTRLLDGPRRLRCLVLVPTRELAAKVETGTRDFSRFTDLRVAVVHPGAPLAMQEKTLRETEVDLLVATPSRLLELQARQVLHVDDIELLVLDEADRMMDLGFAPDLRKILKFLPETRQTLMFAATMPPELNRVAKEALVEPIRIDLGVTTKPTPGLTQAIYPVPRDLKFELLNEMISRQEARSMVIFTRTKEAAERLTRNLTRSGHSVEVLHASRSQAERDRALADLKRERLQIVVATEQAGRGIDVDGISHVINFDAPHVPEDYVHRIRRSGPEGGTGDAFTLMSPEEQKEVAAIERFLGRVLPRVLLPDFDYRMRPAELKQAVSYNSDLSSHASSAAKGNSKPVPKVAAKPAARPAVKPAARPHSSRPALKVNGSRTGGSRAAHAGKSTAATARAGGAKKPKR